ncbi:MAG: hypothetical protein ACRD08_21380, partial [Acidimicrobiales bacterium]
MTVVYLLFFIAPQVLNYLYLRERLPDPRRPERARVLRLALALLFGVANLPWLIVAHRILFGSIWGVGRIPYIGPWLAWQIVGWGFCGLVVLYLIGKGVWWLATKVRGG